MQPIRLNALIPRDVTVPKGSGDRGSGRSSRLRTLQRVRRVEAAEGGANRQSVAERKGRTGSGSNWLEAKWQAGIVDPGMEAVKAAAVAGEGKAVTSIRPRQGEKLQRASSVDPAAAKSVVGERRSEALGAPGCSAQCRACRW